MIALPWREARSQTAGERDERARQLRLVLGPVEHWPEDWVVELRERASVAELGGQSEWETAEREATEVLRAELLGRLP